MIRVFSWDLSMDGRSPRWLACRLPGFLICYVIGVIVILPLFCGVYLWLLWKGGSRDFGFYLEK